MPLIETEPLREILQNLAAMPPTEFPFVSAYVDLSPMLDMGTRVYTGPDPDAYRSSGKQNQAVDRGPVRVGIREMHDRLLYKDDLFDERGSERESYDLDKAKITEFLETDSFDDQAKGVAIFACAGQDIWHVAELAVPVTTRLYVGRTPLLFPLAELMENYDKFALVVAETENANIYVISMGRMEIEESIDGPNVNRTQKGGWSQKRYQQRVDNAMSGHIKDTAKRLEQLVLDEQITYIVLSGDVTAITNFRTHLRQDTLDKVVQIESSQANTPKDVAIQEAMQAVLAAEQNDARDSARQARDQALAENLGTFGEHAVRYALEQGAVHILLMASDFAAINVREEFTEAALATGAQIDFVEDSADLRRMHGVAAILRFRPDMLPDHPQIRSQEQVTPEDDTDEAAMARRNQEENDTPAPHATPGQHSKPDREPAEGE